MKRFIYKNLLPLLGFIIVKLISITYRTKIIDQEYEKAVLESGEFPIYISWHQRFIAGVTILSKRRPIAALVSMSKDGDIIANILKYLGWNPVRGSSSRGEIKALKEAIRLSRKGYSFGHIVDGPRGPFGLVKPGVIMIAKFSRMPILPFIISPENKWTFNSWDKFMLPKPFSRVIVRFDKGIYVPNNIGKEDIEEYRLMLEKKLEKLYIEADEYWH